MDGTRMLAEDRGYFTRREALDLGTDDRELTVGVRERTLLRPRRGVYAYTDLWQSYDQLERHRVLCRAVLARLGPHAVLSHASAAVAHGIALWGHDLATVHVTRLDGASGRQEAGVAHHLGRVADDDRVEVLGLPAVAADRAAIETATLGTSEQALVVLDSVRHLGLTGDEALGRRFAVMAHWPDMQRLHLPMRMADGGSQSVGESRGRWLFRQTGLPCPDLQVEVRNADGALVGTADWGWRERGLLGEFDGRLKYGRLLDPGQEPGDAVFAEKRREDLMREASGCGMVRLIWSDLSRPVVTSRRIRALLQ